MTTTQNLLTQGETTVTTDQGTELTLIAHSFNGSLVIGIGDPIDGEEVVPMTLEQDPANPTTGQIWRYDRRAPGAATLVRDAADMTDPISECLRAWSDYTATAA